MKIRAHLIRLAMLSLVSGLLLCAPATRGNDLDMQYIPSASFVMGDLFFEGYSDEQPTHTVSPSTGFLISRFEVTNAQYAQALNWARGNAANLPETERITGPGGAPYAGGAVYVRGRKIIDIGDPGGFCQIVYADGLFSPANRSGTSMANHPVVMVTWHGALAFCNWESRRLQIPPAYDTSLAYNPSTGNDQSLQYERNATIGFRLPSEAEWQMAASYDPTLNDPQSGKNWRFGYTGSQNIGLSRANFTYNSTPNNPMNLDSAPYTSIVGFYNGVNIARLWQTIHSRSHYGCYDMSGNAAEWVQDAYYPNYNGAPTDGSAWEGLADAERVVRGGSWADEAPALRTAARSRLAPSQVGADGTIGFRVARTAAATTTAPTLLTLSAATVRRDQVISGTLLTVTGTGFHLSAGYNMVRLTTAFNFASVPASWVNPAGTEIRFAVPTSILPANNEYPTTVILEVESDGRLSSNHLAFTLTSPGSAIENIEMTVVPAGSFIMGDPWGTGDSDERPLRTVTFAEDYAIGVYETTNAQFCAALNWALENAAGLPFGERISGYGGAPYTGGTVYVNGDVPAILVGHDTCMIDFNDGIFEVRGRDGQTMADHPVVMVSWYGALAFCNWQSRSEGLDVAYENEAFSRPLLRTPGRVGGTLSESPMLYAMALNDSSANGYRLPSEAEWERAAAIDPTRVHPVSGQHYRYAFRSDEIHLGQANYYDSKSFSYGNPLVLSAIPFTSPVGFFDGVNVGAHGSTVDSKSFYGCYDMSGNVFEWCQDWYYESYIGAPTDGSAWDGPLGQWRVVRGGSWLSPPEQVRSANRDGSGPMIFSAHTGFRVARSLTPVPPPPPASVNGWDHYR